MQGSVRESGLWRESLATSHAENPRVLQRQPQPAYCVLFSARELRMLIAETKILREVAEVCMLYLVSVVLLRIYPISATQRSSRKNLVSSYSSTMARPKQ